MAKTYVRVDDRLIHGQTIVAWAPMLHIDELVVVDDPSASNATLRSILTMAVPKTYKAHIVTTEEARELLSHEPAGNRLVIVKTPHQLMDIKDQIAGCEHIYLGNMAKRPDTDHQNTGATGIFYLSDQDVADLNQLTDEGFAITFEQLPSPQPQSWVSFAQKL